MPDKLTLKKLDERIDAQHDKIERLVALFNSMLDDMETAGVVGGTRVKQLRLLKEDDQS